MLLKTGRLHTVSRAFLRSVGRAKELAEHEKLGFSYLTRVLRLSLLAPDIVETILEGRQSAEMKLASLLEPFPVGWEEQIVLICCLQNLRCSRLIRYK